MLVKIHSIKKVIDLVTKPQHFTQKEIGDLTAFLNHSQQFSGMMETAPLHSVLEQELQLHRLEMAGFHNTGNCEKMKIK